MPSSRSIVPPSLNDHSLIHSTKKSTNNSPGQALTENAVASMILHSLDFFLSFFSLFFLSLSSNFIPKLLTIIQNSVPSPFSLTSSLKWHHPLLCFNCDFSTVKTFTFVFVARNFLTPVLLCSVTYLTFSPGASEHLRLNIITF